MGAGDGGWWWLRFFFKRDSWRDDRLVVFGRSIVFDYSGRKGRAEVQVPKRMECDEEGEMETTHVHATSPLLLRSLISAISPLPSPPSCPLERECCRACAAGDACPAQQEHGGESKARRRERNRAWNYRAPLSLPTNPTETTGQREGARIIRVTTTSLLGWGVWFLTAVTSYLESSKEEEGGKRSFVRSHTPPFPKQRQRRNYVRSWS